MFLSEPLQNQTKYPKDKKRKTNKRGCGFFIPKKKSNIMKRKGHSMVTRESGLTEDAISVAYNDAS